MRVHVAFTPDEVLEAPVAVVVDVMRATSTIAQALASGYERVYCCREIEDARALREQLGEGLLGGERSAVQIEGFDIGASPREVLEPRASTLIYSTTNGTRGGSRCGCCVRDGLPGLAPEPLGGCAARWTTTA